MGVRNRLDPKWSRCPLREYLNENTLFSSVALLAKAESRPILVVEGPDDSFLVKQHCEENLVVLMATGGVSQLIGAATRAIGDNLPNVRFLADRDYTDFRPDARRTLTNVFLSETHDVFTDLHFAEPSILLRVIALKCDSAARRPDGSENTDPPAHLLEKTLLASRCLAAGRIVSEQQDLRIPFERFSFSNLDPGPITLTRVLATLRDSCGMSDSLGESFDQAAAGALSRYCSGPLPPVGDHDLFSALTYVLRISGIQIRTRDARHLFVMGVTFSTFAQTSFFRAVEKWCRSLGVSISPDANQET